MRPLDFILTMNLHFFQIDCTVTHADTTNCNILSDNVRILNTTAISCQVKFRLKFDLKKQLKAVGNEVLGGYVGEFFGDLLGKKVFALERRDIPYEQAVL